MEWMQSRMLSLARCQLKSLSRCSSSSSAQVAVKEFLSQNFETKDLGEADVILNIKLVKEINGGVILTQSHYVEKVLSRFGYSDYKPVSTPYDTSLILRKN